MTHARWPYTVHLPRHDERGTQSIVQSFPTQEDLLLGLASMCLELFQLDITGQVVAPDTPREPS